MKILNMVLDCFIYVPTTTELSWPEISAMIEILTDSEPHGIVKFYIYGFILPILKVIIDKNMAKRP